MQAQEKLEAYGKRYHAIKAPRKLVWQPALGMVTLSLLLGDQTKEFTVSPVQASILLYFQVRTSLKVHSMITILLGCWRVRPTFLATNCGVLLHCQVKIAKSGSNMLVTLVGAAMQAAAVSCR